MRRLQQLSAANFNFSHQQLSPEINCWLFNDDVMSTAVTTCDRQVSSSTMPRTLEVQQLCKWMLQVTNRKGRMETVNKTNWTLRFILNISHPGELNDDVDPRVDVTTRTDHQQNRKTQTSLFIPLGKQTSLLTKSWLHSVVWQYTDYRIFYLLCQPLSSLFSLHPLIEGGQESIFTLKSIPENRQKELTSMYSQE